MILLIQVLFFLRAMLAGPLTPCKDFRGNAAMRMRLLLGSPALPGTHGCRRPSRRPARFGRRPLGRLVHVTMDLDGSSAPSSRFFLVVAGVAFFDRTRLRLKFLRREMTLGLELWTWLGATC